jgi:hypothetical protein
MRIFTIHKQKPIMKTKNRFRTKAGNLTPYALACGYIEEKERGGVRVTLWHEGGPLYHVRKHDFNKGERVFWESFERLTDARALFRRAWEGGVA